VLLNALARNASCHKDPLEANYKAIRQDSNPHCKVLPPQLYAVCGPVAPVRSDMFVPCRAGRMALVEGGALEQRRARFVAGLSDEAGAR
jgi:hypothetical protein